MTPVRDGSVRDGSVRDGPVRDGQEGADCTENGNVSDAHRTRHLATEGNDAVNHVTLNVPEESRGGTSDNEESAYGDTLTQSSITALLSKKFKVTEVTSYVYNGSDVVCL